MNPSIALLLEVLDQAFDAKGWHGTTLSGSLRGVGLKQAEWRPSPRRHSIRDLVLHTAYWKYVVRRRVLGETDRGGFARGPSNWPAAPERTDRAWKEDVRLLKRSHAALREVVAGLSPGALAHTSPSGAWTYREMIHGVAAHDLYHTGQIQLLKRLYAGR